MILDSSDKRGGTRKSCKGYSHFSQFITHNILSQVDYVGPVFTWRKGTLLQCLDRALTNMAWLSTFPKTLVQHMPNLQSDHRSLLINTWVSHM